MPLPLVGAVAASGVVEKPANIVGSVVGGIGDALGLGGSDRDSDKGRIAALNVAFERAVTGDVPAALYIRQRTGHFPGVTVPGYGFVSSGGSDPAQRHARIQWATLQKEYPAVAQGAKQMAAGNPVTAVLPGQVVDPTNLGREADHTIQPIASAPALAGIDWPIIPLMIAAFVVFGVLRAPKSAS